MSEVYDLIKLSDICEINIGKTPSRKTPEYWNGDHLWLSIGDMGKSKNITDTKEKITDEGAKLFKNRLVEPDTLLFSFKLSIGKVGIAKVPLYTNEAIASLPIKDKSKLYHGYLFYALQSLDLTGKTDRAVMGNTLNKRKLEEIKIPLPPIALQRRIADILDTADRIIQKRKKAIALTEELQKSIFLDMFGDPITNPKGWEVKKLEDVCHKVTDGTHQSPQWEIKGIPFIFVSNIVNGEIDFNVSKYISEDSWQQLTLRCPIEINDILYTTVGSYGNAALVRTNKKFCFQRHIAHIKPNPEEIEPEFLLELMQSDGIKKQADTQVRGIAQKTLNLRELKTFPIFNPPMILQKKYIGIRRNVESQLKEQEKFLKESENLFNSLSQKAFKGEL
ncbi:restriction modification system DNA specificity domain protein [Cyanobacterium stanieri PCC 7202]|uniref:Restriction modification system DNA specificity domain protein n=1 Tax=Cyanobacterium stanieri (strain ATCC 29140 / PCC 7202) TaxID=292563 RepID=K9YGP5_CYASC|nr:restriction modification system DNA specificity domain protein [Cyanobacterium stanieri PCC 7202]